MPSQVTASPFLTKREAAAYLRRSVRSIDRRQLPRIKEGGIVLFRRESLDEAMKAKEVTT